MIDGVGEVGILTARDRVGAGSHSPVRIDNIRFGKAICLEALRFGIFLGNWTPVNLCHSERFSWLT